VPPELLSLELTESAALFDDRGAVRQLHALREAGVNLSIDDFGTGYSSRMRVLDLPISTIKLDRSLTQRLPTDRRTTLQRGRDDRRLRDAVPRARARQAVRAPLTP